MHHHFTRRAACALALAAAAPLAAWAQHAHHGAQQHATPYAGQQAREIKALSAEDTQRLLQGQGMSLALAAELNGYPGPLHVLELAQPLRLSERQREDTAALMARHKAEARALGAQLVQAERELDRAFAGGQAGAAEVDRLAQRIGALQGALRAAHLKTHLEQTALLTREQVRDYALLRGYGERGGPAGHGAPQ